MALPLWGQLQKSQDDASTIDEAIADAIAEHNDDPEAHLDTDQSLEAHKADPILDHPEGSVYADKFSNQELIWSTNFGEADLWTKVDVHDYDWPGMFLPEDGTDETTSYMSANFQNVMGSTLPLTWDYYWQAFAYIDDSPSDYTYHIGFGVKDGLEYDGFGFRDVAGACSVFFKIGANVETSAIDSFADGEKHNFRAQFVALDQQVHFYIDGVEVAVLDKPTGTPSTALWWGFSELNGSAGGYGMGVFNLILTRFP